MLAGSFWLPEKNESKKNVEPILNNDKKSADTEQPSLLFFALFLCTLLRSHERVGRHEGCVGRGGCTSPEKRQQQGIEGFKADVPKGPQKPIGNPTARNPVDAKLLM